MTQNLHTQLAPLISDKYNCVIPETKKIGKEKRKIQIVQDKPSAARFTYTINEISLPSRL